MRERPRFDLTGKEALVTGGAWGMPSRNNRHLAIYGWSLSANIWMIENF
jgi:hypothetical protein